MKRSKSSSQTISPDSIQFVRKNPSSGVYENLENLPSPLKSETGTNCIYNAIIDYVEFQIETNQSEMTKFQILAVVKSLT